MKEYLTTLNYTADKDDLDAVDAIAERRTAENGLKGSAMKRSDLIHHAIAQIQESPEKLTNYIQRLFQENLYGK